MSGGYEDVFKIALDALSDSGYPVPDELRHVGLKGLVQMFSQRGRVAGILRVDSYTMRSSPRETLLDVVRRIGSQWLLEYAQQRAVIYPYDTTRDPFRNPLALPDYVVELNWVSDPSDRAALVTPGHTHNPPMRLIHDW